MSLSCTLALRLTVVLDQTLLLNLISTQYRTSVWDGLFGHVPMTHSLTTIVPYMLMLSFDAFLSPGNAQEADHSQPGLTNKHRFPYSMMQHTRQILAPWHMWLMMMLVTSLAHVTDDDVGDVLGTCDWWWCWWRCITELSALMFVGQKPRQSSGSHIGSGRDIGVQSWPKQCCWRHSYWV